MVCCDLVSARHRLTSIKVCLDGGRSNHPFKVYRAFLPVEQWHLTGDVPEVLHFTDKTYDVFFVVDAYYIYADRNAGLPESAHILGCGSMHLNHICMFGACFLFDYHIHL
jgi:hypothetical protein